MRKAIDYTGQKRGRLQVLERLPNEAVGFRRVMWLCLCDCGEMVSVASPRLGDRHHGRISCGCLRKEHIVREGRKRHLEPRERLLRAVFRMYRSHAKGRKKTFSLSKEDLYELVFSNCHYCASPPSNGFILHGYPSEKYSGIDRVDNSIGYEPGNVVPCCWMCNRAKKDLPLKDFMGLIERVYKKWFKGPAEVESL